MLAEYVWTFASFFSSFPPNEVQIVPIRVGAFKDPTSNFGIKHVTFAAADPVSHHHVGLVCLQRFGSRVLDRDPGLLRAIDAADISQYHSVHAQAGLRHADVE